MMVVSYCFQGLSFYQSYVQSWCHRWNINMDEQLCADDTISILSDPRLFNSVCRTAPDITDRHQKLALSSIARFMLTLGDLNRYRANASNTTDFSKARE